MIINRVLNPINNLKQIFYYTSEFCNWLENSIFPLIKKLQLKILSQVQSMVGKWIPKSKPQIHCRYTLFHVKNCFNKILLLLLLLENSINRYYLIKKKIIRNYIPINLYTHNLWATRRIEMQKLGAGWGEVRAFGRVAGGGGRGAGFRGGSWRVRVVGISLLTEPNQKGTVHRSVP